MESSWRLVGLLPPVPRLAGGGGRSWQAALLVALCPATSALVKLAGCAAETLAPRELSEAKIYCRLTTLLPFSGELSGNPGSEAEPPPLLPPTRPPAHLERKIQSRPARRQSISRLRFLDFDGARGKGPKDLACPEWPCQPLLTLASTEHPHGA